MAHCPPPGPGLAGTEGDVGCAHLPPETVSAHAGELDTQANGPASVFNLRPCAHCKKEFPKTSNRQVYCRPCSAMGKYLRNKQAVGVGKLADSGEQQLQTPRASADAGEQALHAPKRARAQLHHATPQSVSAASHRSMAPAAPVTTVALSMEVREEIHKKVHEEAELEVSRQLATLADDGMPHSRKEEARAAIEEFMRPEIAALTAMLTAQAAQQLQQGEQRFALLETGHQRVHNEQAGLAATMNSHAERLQQGEQRFAPPRNGAPGVHWTAAACE